MTPANRGHPFDSHVLGMPPAFVLSQDQTLMFNPKPTPRTGDGSNKGLHNANTRCKPNPQPHSQRPSRTSPLRKRPTTRAAARASLPITNNANQQTPPRRERRLVPRSCRDRVATTHEEAWRTVKIGPGPCPVQGQLNKFSAPGSPALQQPERAQFGQHRRRDRLLAASASARPVGRRVCRHQIAPALERPPRPPQRL